MEKIIGVGKNHWSGWDSLMRHISFALLPFLLIGCFMSVAQHRQKMTENLSKQWVGISIDQLVEEKGYPTRKFTAPNGNTVYVYERRRTSKDSSRYEVDTRGNVTEYGGGVTEYKCDLFFEVDQLNEIVKIRLEGNACFGYF